MLTKPDDPWVPIVYREFYDVPRIVVFEVGGVEHCLHCAFDEATDDYPSSYSFYRLSSTGMAGDWTRLPQDAVLLGSIPVDAVRFDETRRSSLDLASLRHLLTA